MKKKVNIFNLLLIFITTIGVLFRLYLILRRDIYVDEVFYTDVAKNNSWLSLITADHWIKNHGILTMLFLKFLSLFTSDIVLMRIPNLFIYVIVNLSIYKFLRAKKLELMAIAFSLLHTISPYFSFMESMVSPFNYALLFTSLFFTKIDDLFNINTIKIKHLIFLSVLAILTWYVDYSTYIILIFVFVIFVYAAINNKLIIKKYLIFISILLISIFPSILFLIKNFKEISAYHPPSQFTLNFPTYIFQISNMFFLRLNGAWLEYLSFSLFILLMVFLALLLAKTKKYPKITYLLSSSLILVILFIFVFSTEFLRIYIERSLWSLYFIYLLIFSLLIDILFKNKIIFYIFISIYLACSIFRVINLDKSSYPGQIPDVTYSFKQLKQSINKKNIKKFRIIYLDDSNNLYNVGLHYFPKTNYQVVINNKLTEISNLNSNYTYIIIAIKYNKQGYIKLKNLVKKQNINAYFFKSVCAKFDCYFIKD